MNVIDHPNITRMIAVFDELEYYILVFELLQGGDLAENFNAEYDDVSEEDIQGLITPLFDAVTYCHDLGIVHRDLKPENILLTCSELKEATVKICDFGLSRQVRADFKARTVAGTPNYIAPEILQCKPYDEKCDYWSLGVILFLLLSGSLPFEHEEHFELFELIKAG